MYFNQNEAKEVKELLKEAFGFGTAKPPKAAVDIDTIDYDPEQKQLHQCFSGKPWWNIEYEVMFQLRDLIPLLSDEGFTYYMPAFISVCLGCERPETNELGKCTVMNLNPKLDDGRVDDYIFDRLNRFDERKRNAIARFVMLFLDCEGLIGDQARSAFNSYWKRYV